MPTEVCNNSQPGDWDPWILIVGGVWALAVLALFGVRQVFERPTRVGEGRREAAAAAVS